MAFQFLCPQGHLLQGDESHMGMQTQCPHCGIVFIIPTVAVQSTYAPQQPEYQAPAYQSYEQPHVDLHDLISQPEPEHFHVPDPEPVQQHAEPASDLLSELEGSEGPSLLSGDMPPACLHIPCPNGHELETPIDMLGQEVLCPHCGAQFRLKNEDSIEFKQLQAVKDARSAEIWFKWAIAAAVVVVLGLLFMLVMIATH